MLKFLRWLGVALSFHFSGADYDQWQCPTVLKTSRGECRCRKISLHRGEHDFGR